MDAAKDEISRKGQQVCAKLIMKAWLDVRVTFQIKLRPLILKDEYSTFFESHPSISARLNLHIPNQRKEHFAILVVVLWAKKFPSLNSSFYSGCLVFSGNQVEVSQDLPYCLAYNMRGRKKQSLPVSVQLDSMVAYRNPCSVQSANQPQRSITCPKPVGS